MASINNLKNIDENKVSESFWKTAGRVVEFLADGALTVMSVGAAATGNVPWIGHTDSELLRLGFGVAAAKQARDTYNSGKRVVSAITGK